VHAFSVRDLLVEGQSLGLAIGSGLDRVIDTLGEPADRSVIRPLVVKYGSVEFTFVDGVVILIAYYAERHRHATASAIGEDLPRSMDAITRLLAEHELDVVVDSALSYDSQRALTVVGGSSATMLFDGTRLTSVQLAG